MAEQWGAPIKNHAPRIAALAFQRLGDTFKPNETFTAKVSGLDPDKDPISVEWHVLAESTDLGKAGDAEAVPPSFPEATRNARAGAGEWSVDVAGLAPGAYRLFVVLHDGKGAAATGNLPFLIR
jgi:hypothetical protein